MGLDALLTLNVTGLGLGSQLTRGGLLGSTAGKHHMDDGFVLIEVSHLSLQVVDSTV